jgi:Arc/MetJ-type ribon-helix-helix transcriptional regulator
MANNPDLVMPDEDFTLPCSVDLFLPPRYERILEELVISGKEIVRTIAIHSALWQMRAGKMTREERRAELIAEIQKSLDSGEGREVTSEFWKELEQRCLARYEWLKTQKEKLGNTTLPDELYQYIQNKIASGQYANPTEVVCAALDQWEGLPVE